MPAYFRFRVSPFVAQYQSTLHCFREQDRSRKFLPLLSTHATPLDTDSPSKILPIRFLCIGFRCVKNVADCIDTLTMLTWLQGCAYPLWPMWFSVYASCILLCSRLPQSKPLATLRRIRNTRYGWLVRPYEIPILGFLPSGSFTLKEATSFACRTNAKFS